MPRLLPALVALLAPAALAPAALAQAPVLATRPSADAPVPFAGAPGAVTYQYDDGAANVTLGPPSTFDPDMLWGNYFVTDPQGEAIVELQVAFGATFPSRENGVTFWLLDDPDADLDPRNATALASVTAVPDVSGNEAFVVPFPETVVSGAFFVGASAQLLGGQDAPARVDTDGRADRSWFFYDGRIADVIDDLASAAFGTRMDDASQVPLPGAFMVRAVGMPRGLAAAGAPDLGARLGAPVPNPSAGAASVPFALDQAGTVRLDVVDVLGRTVARLADGPHAAGVHAARLDAPLAPGTYVVRLTSEGGAATTRLSVVR